MVWPMAVFACCCCPAAEDVGLHENSHAAFVFASVGVVAQLQPEILSSVVVRQASEVEETLKRIRSHRGVEGILIVNNDGVALKSTLSAELTSQYASLFSQVLSVCCAIAFRNFRWRLLPSAGGSRCMRYLRLFSM
jgi:hypothetical protein